MLHLQHQSRFIHNSTQFSYAYVKGGALYRITKDLRVNLNYVFISKKRDDPSFSYRHQMEGYLNYRKKMGDFVLFDRLMTSMQVKDFNSNPQGKRVRDYYLRNKITLRYKHFRHVVPYVSEETFYKFDGRYYEKGIRRARISMGILYNLNENWLAESSYTMEYNRDSKIPSNNYFISLGLVRTFFQ